MIPPGEKPITHLVVVSSPIQLHRWATSQAGTQMLAEQYRGKGCDVAVAPIHARRAIALWFDLLVHLQQVADSALCSSPPSFRLVAGEYEDGM